MLGLCQLVLEHEDEDITALRVHVHLLDSRLQVLSFQKMTVLMCL